MTREEFDEITTVYELLDAAQNYGCEDVESVIYSEDSREYVLDERAYECARDEGWRDLLSMFQGWESEDGYDYYYEDDWCNFYPLEDGSAKFNELKETLLNYILDDCGFDDDDDDVEIDFDEAWGPDDEYNDDDDSGCSAAEDDLRSFVYEFQTL